jgi:hypothetical protein
MEIRDNTVGLDSMTNGIYTTYEEKKIITAADLQKYLRSGVAFRESSIDRIIIGNPDTKIRKVGTAWTPYFKTLEEAVNLGINILIVYAPVFYMDKDPEDFDSKGRFYFNDTPLPAREQYSSALEKKKKWIESNDMVIIRSRDLPNSLTTPFGLGEKLGFKKEDILRSKEYFNVYRIKRTTAVEIAKKIAFDLKDLNQPGAAFYGDPDRFVSTVGIGTGELCDPRSYAELNPELCIGVDDTIWTWLQTSYAEDTGNPLIVINQGTAEEMGMRLLNEHLRRNIPSVEFEHINQGCDYEWITG